jgi:hypothetical protein
LYTIKKKDNEDVIEALKKILVGEERWMLAQGYFPLHIWSQRTNKFTAETIESIRHHIP